MGDINHKTITTPPINQPSRRKMEQCVIGLDRTLLIFSYPPFLTYVVSAQKDCLIKTILLRIHKICFD